MSFQVFTAASIRMIDLFVDLFSCVKCSSYFVTIICPKNGGDLFVQDVGNDLLVQDYMPL
jgi:hypothetical protein